MCDIVRSSEMNGCLHDFHRHSFRDSSEVEDSSVNYACDPAL